MTASSLRPVAARAPTAPSARRPRAAGSGTRDRRRRPRRLGRAGRAALPRLRTAHRGRQPPPPLEPARPRGRPGARTTASWPRATACSVSPGPTWSNGRPGSPTPSGEPAPSDGGPPDLFRRRKWSLERPHRAPKRAGSGGTDSVSPPSWLFGGLYVKHPRDGEPLTPWVWSVSIEILARFAVVTVSTVLSVGRDRVGERVDHGAAALDLERVRDALGEVRHADLVRLSVLRTVPSPDLVTVPVAVFAVAEPVAEVICGARLLRPGGRYIDERRTEDQGDEHGVPPASPATRTTWPGRTPIVPAFVRVPDRLGKRPGFVKAPGSS